MTKAPKKSDVVTKASIEALERLMQAYGIEAGDYLSLALRLASDHVPGFPRFKLQHGDYGKVMRDMLRAYGMTEAENAEDIELDRELVNIGRMSPREYLKRARARSVARKIRQRDDAGCFVAWLATRGYDGASRRSSHCSGRRSRSPAG